MPLAIAYCYIIIVKHKNLLDVLVPDFYIQLAIMNLNEVVHQLSTISKEQHSRPHLCTHLKLQVHHWTAFKVTRLVYNVACKVRAFPMIHTYRSTLVYHTSSITEYKQFSKQQSLNTKRLSGNETGEGDIVVFNLRCTLIHNMAHDK